MCWKSIREVENKHMENRLIGSLEVYKDSDKQELWCTWKQDYSKTKTIVYCIDTFEMLNNRNVLTVDK